MESLSKTPTTSPQPLTSSLPSAIPLSSLLSSYYHCDHPPQSSSSSSSSMHFHFVESAGSLSSTEAFLFSYGQMIEWRLIRGPVLLFISPSFSSVFLLKESLLRRESLDDLNGFASS